MAYMPKITSPNSDLFISLKWFKKQKITEVPVKKCSPRFLLGSLFIVLLYFRYKKD